MAAQTNTAPRKFLFETSFEQEALEKKKVQVETPPEPAFFDEDLTRARSEGLAAGQETGRQEALQSIEDSAVKALDAIARQLPELQGATVKMREAQLRAAVEVSMAMVRKFFPKLSKDQGLTEIEAVVSDAMARLHDEPRVVIRVCGSLLDTLKGRVDAIAVKIGFEGKIVFLAEDGMTVSDVRVEWADGGAERDTDRIWRDIDDSIRHMTGDPAQVMKPTKPAPQDSTNPDTSA